MYIVHTVGENIIAITKIRNNYGAIKSLNFPIVALKGDSEKITVSFR